VAQVKAVMRMEKVKSVRAIDMRIEHNDRDTIPANADPSRTPQNERLVGTDNPRADAMKMLAPPLKISKNSTLAIEVILSASPEWFKTASPEQDAAWKTKSMGWLDDTFGAERIANAYLHRDEKTTHIHAVIIPVVSDGPRGLHLAASRWMDGIPVLSGHQTSYALAVADLGITRGDILSPATHENQHHWYTQETARQRDAKEASRQLTVETPGRVQGNPAAWARSQQERIQQDAYPLLYDALSRAAAAELRADRAAATQQVHARELLSLRGNYKALADQVRRVDIRDVLRDLGATRDPKDATKWRYDDQIITTEKGGQGFTQHNPDALQTHERGGAIDMVKQLTGLSFKDAVDYLAQHHGIDAATAATREHMTRAATAQVERSGREPFRAPPPDPRAWPQVRDYLTHERCLPAAAVDAAHDRGDLYAERLGRNVNAVFIRRGDDGRMTGALRRGTSGTFRGLVRGTQREAGYFGLDIGRPAQGVIPALVLVESPIDALSYAATHGAVHGRIISTDGAGALPTREITTALGKGWTVRGAFDRDSDGDALHRQLTAGYPTQSQGSHQQIRRERPQGKDWNDDVRMERQKPAQERERTPEKGPSRSGPTPFERGGR